MPRRYLKLVQYNVHDSTGSLPSIPNDSAHKVSVVPACLSPNPRDQGLAVFLPVRHLDSLESGAIPVGANGAIDY